MIWTGMMTQEMVRGGLVLEEQGTGIPVISLQGKREGRRTQHAFYEYVWQTDII